MFDNGWNCYWHFAFWYREDNIKNNKDNLFPGVGDMNILAIYKDQNQPKDLMKLENYDEDWDQDEFLDFYNKNKLKII